MMGRAIGWVAVLGLAVGLAGCRVHVDKGANGEDKTVQVDTPFGGVHVNTNQTTAADLGLSLYPGAVAVKADEKHKSADVHLGFGAWELRVRAVTYESADSEDKVKDFYKKGLGRYGDVIECHGNVPLGNPSVTSEGLTCADNDKNANVKIDRGDYGTGKNSLELKAGSKRHQHIVGFEDPQDGRTRFVLVALDLPAAVEGDQKKHD
jgi:hypothetical protein